MGNRLFAAILLTMPMLGGLVGQASSQETPQKHALGLDAGPSTPDPLAPPEVTGPPPSAPGAPTAPVEAKPAAEADPIVKQVRERLSGSPTGGNPGDREDYAALAKFYAEGSGQPVWMSKDGFTARATQAIGEMRKADDWGLKASAFDLPSLPEGAATDAAIADAEIKLGVAFLKYARYARGGRFDPASISRLFDQKPTVYDPKSLMQAIAVTDDVDTADAYLRNLHPKHPQFERLRQAMLAARGVKPDAPAPSVKIPVGTAIKPGQEHEQIALLRQRLATPAAPESKDTLYDDTLVTAVKAVQVQAGMEPSGIINAATRNALNGVERPTSAGNVQRLLVNMERWRWMPEDLGEFYVWDSVPEQMTSVFDKGNQVLSEKIVVGKPSSPTPVFSADMQFVIFHPSWGVPSGIKSYELAPALRSAGGGWFFGGGASSVLKSYNLRVSRGGRPVDPDSINWSNVDINGFDFQQPPGPTNVLGIVKFRFPNKHDVYMHDTPERNLFSGPVRAFSHGCMRVQNPIKLAEVLLAHDKGMSAEDVQGYVRRGGEIKLTKPIPVHVTYFTAVVDDAGKTHFRPDLYGLDSRVASKLEGQTVSLVTSSIEKPEAVEKSASETPAARQARARPKQKSASQSSNPFAAIFGN